MAADTASPTATLRDDFLAALLARDATRARHLVDDAVRRGLGVNEVYLEVLEPALVEIGERWAQGEIGVAAEHFAAAVADGIVGALGPRLRVPPSGGRLAVVACSPGEQHALGVRMTGDFLEAAGWEVLQLGASVPADSIAALAADEQADVVALSTATPGRLSEVRDAIAELRALEPAPFVVVGGRAWRDAPPDRAAALGVDACVTHPMALVGLLAERFPAVPEEPED